jgi:HEAT repeat protein
VTSEDMPQVSGSIGVTPPGGILRQKSTDELLAELEDRHKRVAAALELCERGDARAAGPVIAAVTKMSRAEAVRVLGMSVKFGDAASKPLIEGLTSSKGFLRHGCALALALLRTEDGTQAVIDLLMGEPTEIWREVARAIGQVGPQGLLPLAANFGRLGERATPQIAERVAWAMAHIAVRGGKPAVETMAHGQSVVAPVARQALELHASAANDQVRVRPGAGGSQAGKDITVNRAFSRRFFEALEQGLPEAAVAGLEALEASGPMELLDESDLLVEDDDEAELDESDLIQ